MKKFYDIRLNGETIALVDSLEEAKEIYEAKKEANPYGYYEVYELR